MEEITESNMSEKEPTKDDFEDITCKEVENQDKESDDYGELLKIPERYCDAVCDNSTMAKVDLEQEIQIIESCHIDKLDDITQTHNKKRKNEILGDYIEKIVEVKHDQIDTVYTEPTKQISESKGRGWSCFKIIFFLSSTIVWISFLVYCYLYLTTVCVPVELWCPSPTHTFTAQACCSSLWLNLGSTVGLGNECTIDMADMEAGCPMFDCYKNDSSSELNVNGCSYVPNTLFNEAACNIHDLCYITPGSTKKACDDTFVENIILIYCDNVNVFERIACRGRAQLAGAVVSAIDSFYNDSEDLRRSCNLTSNSLAIFTGMAATLLMTLLIACCIHLVLKRIRTKEQESEEDEVDDTFECHLETVPETYEPVCYCDEPVENCLVCDEVFIEELSLECDINNVEYQEPIGITDSEGSHVNQQSGVEIIDSLDPVLRVEEDKPLNCVEREN